MCTYLRLIFCFTFFLLFLLPHGAEASTFNKPPYVLSLSQGLVGYWTFDGKDVPNGAVTDVSGNGNTGHLTNISTSTFYTMGKVGQGFSFDGTDDYVETPAIDLTGTHAVTVSMWMYLNGTNGLVQNPFSFSNGTGNTFAVEISDTYGDISTRLDVNSNFNSQSMVFWGPPAVGKWQHYVFILDTSRSTTTTGQADMYVDGVFQTPTIKTGTDVNGNFGNNKLNIGNLFYQGSIELQTINGKLDDVRIYNRALTAAEIKLLYNQTSGTKQSTSASSRQEGISRGLVGYWTFDGKDTIGGVAQDKSGNGNTGTLKNISSSTFYTIGKVGQAFNFDGVDDYLQSLSLTDLSGTNTATFSVWVNASTWNPTVVQDVVSFWDNNSNTSGNKFEIEINNSANDDGCTSAGGIVISIFSQNDVNASSTCYAQPSSNVWHHLVGVYNSQTPSTALYIDGVLQTPTDTLTGGSGSIVGNLGNNLVEVGDLFYVGSHFQYFPGLVDDVRLYNRALSASEIKQLYNQTAGAKQNTSQTTMRGTGLTQGLVGYWTFDGKDVVNGVAKDKSGNGNDGNLLNISTSTFYARGKLGQAFDFDGVDDKIILGDVNAFDALSAYTISAWINPRTYGGNGVGRIFDKRDQGATGWQFYVLNGGVTDGLELTHNSGNSYIAYTVSGVIALNTWEHVLATWDGTTALFYVNGTLVSNTLDSMAGQTPIANAVPAVIGGRYGGNDRQFDGLMDDVRLYNRALSASEVKQLYNMTK